MEETAKLLKLLGHPDRLRILALLRRGELTVSELVSVLNLSQPRVTQYIRSLEDVGLLDRLREGSWVFSRLRRMHPSFGLVSLVLESVPVSDPVLKSDLKRLDEVRKARAELAEQFFADVANDRDQLSHEFLPQTAIETAILSALNTPRYDFMVDLGTGTGRMLELLADRVKQGAGIDQSSDMLRVARHKLAGDRFAHCFVQQSDLTQTPLADSVADLVTLHQVLHYLDEPDEALAESARLLRQGGTLLIADFTEHDRDEFRDSYAHRRLGFSDDEIANACNDHGLNITRSSSVPSETEKVPDVRIWIARKESRS